MGKGKHSSWRNNIWNNWSSNRNGQFSHNKSTVDTRPIDLKQVPVNEDLAAILARNLKLDKQDVKKNNERKFVPSHYPYPLKKAILENQMLSFHEWIEHFQKHLPHFHKTLPEPSSADQAYMLWQEQSSKDSMDLMFPYFKTHAEWHHFFKSIKHVTTYTKKYLLDLLCVAQKIYKPAEDYRQVGIEVRKKDGGWHMQQHLSSILYDFIFTRNTWLRLHDIIDTLKRWDYINPNGIESIVMWAHSHAFAMGYFRQEKFKDQYLVLDYNILKRCALYLDHHEQTDFVVIDKWHAMKHATFEMPVYYVDVKTNGKTANNMPTVTLSGKTINGWTNDKMLKALQEHITAAIVRDAATNEKTAEYLSRINMAKWISYIPWKLKITTKLNMERRSELEKMQDENNSMSDILWSSLYKAIAKQLGDAE